MNKIELMAPAGSLQILKAACDSGADAVYLGLGAYNARMNADNFTEEDLIEGCRYAHHRSSKVYLTLNTLVNDYEMSDALITARSAYDAGVDGIIIQDIGLASKIRNEYPDIPLICSTQMNIFNSDALSEIRDMGFVRVVLPRELSLKEIGKRTRMARSLGLETEVFIHGAVCVSCSGLCLFSSMNKSGSRSGNRGLCAQPCRQEYDLFAGKTKIKSGHLLSPKDRSSVPYVASLIESGVSSFKIEGRMREEGYVVNTVRAYRRLIDAYYDGTLDVELENGVINDLLVSFNRGGSFTTQYLSEKKDPDFLSGEYVGKYGLRMGLLKSKDSKKGTITFAYDDKLPLPSKGDYLSIRQGSLELCSFPIGKVHEAPGSLSVKGLHPEMIDKLPMNKVSVFLMGHDVEISKSDLRKTHIDISIGIEGDLITADAKVNSGINLNCSSYFDVDIPSDFDGNPIDRERLVSQLKKTGDTPFVVDNVLFKSDDDIKCRISLINELRRGVLDALISDIDYKYERETLMNSFDMFGEEDEDTEAVSSEEGENLRLHIFPSYKRFENDLVRDTDMYGFSIYDLTVNGFRKKIVELIKSEDSKLVVVMPDFCHDKSAAVFETTLKELKDELGDAFYAILDSKTFTDSDIYSSLEVKHFLSAGSNIYNSESFKKVTESCDGAFISYEIDPNSVSEILSGNSKDKTVLLHSEGLIPWMQSHFCAIGAHKDGCRSCYDPVTYSLKGDGNECIIISRPADCSSVIYGPAKFHYDDEQISAVNDMGFDTISVEVEI